MKRIKMGFPAGRRRERWWRISARPYMAAEVPSPHLLLKLKIRDGGHSHPPPPTGDKSSSEREISWLHTHTHTHTVQMEREFLSPEDAEAVQLQHRDFHAD